MEIITETLAANQTKQLRKAGSYFEIIESSYAIGVAFYSVSGGQINSIKGGLSGLYLDADFGAFDLTNGPTAQTVTMLICDADESGGSRRQPGVVQVTNSVQPNATWFESGLTLTTGFQVAQTIFAPGANAKGVRVRYASVNAKAGAGGQADSRLVAAPVTPVSGQPANGFCIAQISTTDSANVQSFNSGHMNVSIPAGWGLYAVTQHTTAAAQSSGAILIYEPLV